MSELKFDTLVDSTLRMYYEMVAPAPASTSFPTQLTGIEQEAVSDAVNSANQSAVGAPLDMDQKRLADLALKRKTQLQQASRTAAQKLQKVVSAPVTPAPANGQGTGNYYNQQPTQAPH